MDHFGEDHDVVRGLNDLVQVVVEVSGQGRRAGSRTKSQDAPLTQGAEFGIIVRAGRLQSGIAALRGIRCRSDDSSPEASSRGRRQWWNLPIGRIDDDRRSLL